MFVDPPPNLIVLCQIQKSCSPMLLEFNNFVGDYVGSVKEADFTFIPRIGPGRQQSAAYPSVVLESGWYESSTRLLADSRLWQEGSAGAVQVVLQVKFYEPDDQNKMRLVLFISRFAPGGGPTQHDHYASSFACSIFTVSLLTCQL